jgi:hypothetical protein
MEEEAPEARDAPPSEISPSSASSAHYYPQASRAAGCTNTGPAQRATFDSVPRSGLYADTGPAQRATFDSVPRSGLHLTACRVREQRVLLVSLHFVLLLVLEGINHLAIVGGIRAQRASQCCPGGASTQQSDFDKQSRLRFSDEVADPYMHVSRVRVSCVNHA